MTDPIRLQEWKNVVNVWTGKLNVSVLLELDDENDNHRTILHVYNDRITSYSMTAMVRSYGRPMMMGHVSIYMHPYHHSPRV
jgi:hypothetical protein